MTLIAVLVFIGILYYCGLGPTLLLFRPKEWPSRLALMPAFGLCSHIIFSIFLAQFSLTGRTISIIAIPFFGCLAVLGWRRSRVLPGELRAAAPGILLGFFSAGFFGWPLIYAGMSNYWGLANPDQGFLIPVMEWIHTHTLGVPPFYSELFRHLGLFRDVPVATLLGVFYVTSTLSLITGIPMGLLFNVTALGFVYLVPGSVYTLCQTLQLRKRISLTAAALAACSSLTAYTFYLDSLGAISVIAILPVACVLTLQFVRKPMLDTALPLVLFCAGMFYNYIGMIGLLGVLIGAAVLHGVLIRAIAVRLILWFAGATAALIAVLFAPFAVSTLKFFLEETFGGRFARTDETQLFMALTGLTEWTVPYFWGLRLPTAGAWPFVQNPEGAFAAGVMFFLMLLYICCRRGSDLPAVFRLMLAAVLGVILFYGYRKVGYGVFKLVAWVHPLVVVALTASAFTLSERLFSRKHRALSWVALSALPLYAVPNLALALRLGYTVAFPKDGVLLHNAPNLSFKDVRELRPAGERWSSEGLIAALPDPVATAWARPTLHDIQVPQVPFFPLIALNVFDSRPRATTAIPPGELLLHWNNPELDVAPLPACPAVWFNATFALSPLKNCRNTLVVGQGWYRVEGSRTGLSASMERFRWLRKRGELLILYPSARPQRLRVGMIAGPGNPSPQRTISVFLNGVLIDRLKIAGAAHFMTKPFVVPGPASQIELLVEEDAQPLPRRMALWNRWVPSDPRRLNVAVTSIALVDSTFGNSLPSYFDAAASAEKRAPFEGIYLDRWMGATATITLASPAPAPKELTVRGTAPGGVGLPFPFRFTPSFNGVPLPPCEIPRPGTFQARCPIPEAIRKSMRPAQAVQINLKPEETFRAAEDPRELSLRLERVELAP